MSRLPAPARRLAIVPLALLALPLLSARSDAQYRREKYPEKGLEVQRPRKYEYLQVQPTERWIQLRYVEERDERSPKPTPPELTIVQIDWVPDPEPEPAPIVPKEEEEEGDERSRSKPAQEETPEEVPLPISNLERYVEQEMHGFELGAPVELRKPRSQDGYELREYHLVPRGKQRLRGYAFEWKSDARTIAVLGLASEGDFEDQLKTWRHVAEKLAISEPVESRETQRWRRYYELRPQYSAPEFRLKIRASNLGDWEVDDSDNYILVYSTKKEALIRSLKQRLEAIRKAYLELFPPVDEIDAVSAVRICRDAAEYRLYGGPPRTGGYWHAVAEELVFFDYEDKDGERGSGKEDSLIVLYHEAFHQYIYYSVGEVAPHSWFNEGYGDYFSGAVFNSYGEVQKIGVNPWRIHTIQRAIEEYDYVPWDEIIEYEQSQYYRNPAVCYAQGWSMIYFLNQSPEVRRNERWSQILPIYFDELKKAHALEAAQLERSGLEDDLEQRAEAAVRTRKEAVDAAFEGVDLREIEEAWAAFTRGLSPPR